MARGRFETDIRSMTTGDLIEELHSIYMIDEDWATRRFNAISIELERRNIILDNRGNIINIDFSVELANDLIDPQQEEGD